MDISHSEILDIFGYEPSTGVLSDRVTGTAVGRNNGNGYVRVQVKGRSLLAHRVIWFYVTGKWPKAAMDHRNGVRSDNRWENLREATWAQNNQNRRQVSRPAKSGYTGVYPNGKRWSAQISANGKSFFLGLHDTPEQAHAAYLSAKAIYHPFAGVA